MIVFILLMCLAALSSGQLVSKRLEPDLADPKEYPYMVYIKTIKFKSISCTGSIINERWILTAAQCLKLMPNITMMRVGSLEISGDDYEVEKAIAHEGYKYFPLRFPDLPEESFINDIALLKTKKKIALKKGFVSLVKLPTKQVTNNLMAVLPVPAPKFVRFANYEVVPCSIPKPNNFCARKPKLIFHGFCRDHGTGAPLVTEDGYQIGVASKGCKAYVGDVFTNVFNLRQWIESKMKENIKKGKKYL